MNGFYNSPTIEQDIEKIIDDIDKDMLNAGNYILADMCDSVGFYLDELVYSYVPIFNSRRANEPSMMFDSLKYDWNWQTDRIKGYWYDFAIESAAQWQQLLGGKVPTISLADAVESGYAMYGAGARPFTERMDYAYEEMGIGDDALTRALQKVDSANYMK